MISIWLFMGPPGCGKGTQASLIKSQYTDIYHLSTGDLLRSEIKANSVFGQRVKSFVEIGKLVPDELVLDIFSRTVSNFPSGSSVILDGFPRTLNQAESLSLQCSTNSFNLAGALWFNISSKVIVQRAVSRRVCVDCGEIYNTESKVPKILWNCDKCGGKVLHRKDDTEEIVSDRLLTYSKDTEPLKKFYSHKDLLFEIDAQEDTLLVQAQILRLLKKM